MVSSLALAMCSFTDHRNYLLVKNILCAVFCQGICCQRAEKRVIVVFRGTVSSHNWLINLKYGTSPIPNPISEEYPDRTDMVDLHTGFSLYMLRQRRDTQMNKIEEIFEKVRFDTLDCAKLLATTS